MGSRRRSLHGDRGGMEQVIATRQTSAVRTLQFITIAWMAVELCVAVFSGVRAHSVALVAFGADSAIELLSALVVLRRFALGPQAERRTARMAAVLLYGLAGYIIATSALALSRRTPHAEPTLPGIALLVAAGFVMPLLGRAKKRLARETESRALRADAAQSDLCGYMSWIALAGLSINYLFHLSWADPFAALLLLPIVLKEAREASKGEVCRCSYRALGQGRFRSPIWGGRRRRGCRLWRRTCASRWRRSCSGACRR